MGFTPFRAGDIVVFKTKFAQGLGYGQVGDDIYVHILTQYAVERRFDVYEQHDQGSAPRYGVLQVHG